MKTRNILLAFGCAVALTACTSNDEPAVAPAMRTVTMSVDVDEPADTRVAYTVDGTTYKFAWSGTEKLRVFYNDGEEKYTDFEIDATSINGKKADFTGTLPTGVTSVTISYAPTSLFAGNNSALLEGTSKGFDDLKVALAERTFLYAEAVAVTEDGKLPDVKLKHAVAYLLLKSGLQVTDSDVTLTSESEETGFMIFSGPGYQYIDFTSTGMSFDYDNSGVVCHIVYVEDGKLSHDILIPLSLKEEDSYTLNCRFGKGKSPNWTYGTTVEQASHTFKPGVIYEVSADTTWEISDFEE